MTYASIYKGIIFIEGQEPTAKHLGVIEFKKRLQIHSQLKTLDIVKDQLIEKNLALGGNAIIDFKYGQKTDGAFWYGSGISAIIPEETKNKIIEKLNN